MARSIETFPRDIGEPEEVPAGTSASAVCAERMTGLSAPVASFVDVAKVGVLRVLSRTSAASTQLKTPVGLLITGGTTALITTSIHSA